MKVTQSIRRIWEDCHLLNQSLKEEVDTIFKSNKKEDWFYKSRLKELESFALKLETGRIDNPKEMEDFLGCLIVVENSRSIEIAQELVDRYFDIRYQKPKDPNLTTKESSSFSFDDLRLYVSLKNNPALPKKGNESIVFEIQIKTFLQHAWSIAVHDLIYKSDGVHWAKERVAYQIRAMLEHAEVSIAEVEKLAKSPALSKTDKETESLSQIISFVKEMWETEDLPIDVRRLAANIKNLSSLLDIKRTELFKIIVQETKLGRGAKTLNLSPYLTVVQSIYNQDPEKLRKFIRV